MNVAMLLSCSSFEGFFGRVQGQTIQSYLETYRNDWAWYYARGLLEHGIRPILYIPSLSSAGRFATPDDIPVRFLPLAPWYRPMENIWLKRLSRRTSPTLYADERLNTMAFMGPLRRALHADQIDVLYIQEYWSGRFDHLATRAGVPVVAADHGGVSNGVLKLWKRKAFKRAVALYSQTPDELEIVHSLGARAYFQPNGCDTSRFFPDPNVKRSKTILTVARLTNRQKRTSDLIRALALLDQDWSLDIVGTGPDLEVLQQIAETSGVAARVRFHGFLKGNAVRDHLQRCGVYAMPSENEAVAIAALEAMGCGCSMVLSRIRAFEQLVTDGVNGRLVPVGDAPALAAAIEEAWKMREPWGAAAVQTVHQRFDTRVLYKNLAQSLRAAAVLNVH